MESERSNAVARKSKNKESSNGHERILESHEVWRRPLSLLLAPLTFLSDLILFFYYLFRMTVWFFWKIIFFRIFKNLQGTEFCVRKKVLLNGEIFHLCPHSKKFHCLFLFRILCNRSSRWKNEENHVCDICRGRVQGGPHFMLAESMLALFFLTCFVLLVLYSLS